MNGVRVLSPVLSGLLLYPPDPLDRVCDAMRWMTEGWGSEWRVSLTLYARSLAIRLHFPSVALSLRSSRPNP